jgi:hypothetical protein
MKRTAQLFFALFLACALPVAAFCATIGSAPQSGKAAFATTRLVVSTGIENKEPVGAGEVLPAGTEKAFCFLEAGSITDDTTATFVWYFSGKEVSRTSVNLKKGERWRTYASKSLRGQKGEWKVDVLDAAGSVVSSVKFKTE